MILGKSENLIFGLKTLTGRICRLLPAKRVYAVVYVCTHLYGLEIIASILCARSFFNVNGSFASSMSALINHQP